MKPSPAKKREVFMTVKWVAAAIPLQRSNWESSTEETFILEMRNGDDGEKLEMVRGL